MNLVGKILTVLIFLMSLVFMGMTVATYSAHKNWREVVMTGRNEVKGDRSLGLKYQLEDLKERNKELGDQNEVVKKEADRVSKAAAVARTEAETAIKTAQEKVDAAQKRLDDANEAMRKAVGANEASQRNLEAKEKELTDVRKAIDDVRKDRDGLFSDKFRLTDELISANNEVARMREEMQRMGEQYRKLMTVARAKGFGPDTPTSDAPPIVLQGLILAVRANGMVEVSVGSDDGLLKGHILHVFRLSEGVNRYLGRVEVMETAPDKSVCQILPQFQKGAIERGDRVASQLQP
jgi:predicted  nucleic acid-binding Zn-ribbon protein